MEKNMNRRVFFKGLAGAGALMATSQISIAAQDGKDASVFARRGGFERLTLGYATVKIGLEKPFSVLHISDTHLTEAYPHEDARKQALKARRRLTFGGMQEQALVDTLAWAKENVDYIVHTGDLIDWQSEANFDLVKKYFGKEMTGSLGNHEFSPDMWLGDIKEIQNEAYKDLTREKIQNAFPFDVRFCSQVVGGVNFITLDDVYGYVTLEQADAFKAEVGKGYPIVLCMHVPFYTEEILRAKHKFWWQPGQKYTDATLPEPYGDYKRQLEDPVTRDFIRYLKGEPLLKAILAGHEHIMVQDKFSPTAMEYVVGGNFLFCGEEIFFI